MVRMLLDPVSEIRAHLLGCPELVLRIEDRIFPGILPPRGARIPCITLRLSGGPRSIRTIDKGHTGLSKPHVEAIVWGNNPDEAAEIARIFDGRMMEAEDTQYMGRMKVGGLQRIEMTEGTHPQLELDQSIRKWEVQCSEWG